MSFGAAGLTGYLYTRTWGLCTNTAVIFALPLHECKAETSQRINAQKAADGELRIVHVLRSGGALHELSNAFSHFIS